MVEINNKKFIIMCIDREKMSGKIEKERWETQKDGKEKGWDNSFCSTVLSVAASS